MNSFSSSSRLSQSTPRATQNDCGATAQLIQWRASVIHVHKEKFYEPGIVGISSRFVIGAVLLCG
ncbi:MAG: hypothetical protein ACKV2V_01330, partial [Blastocatellia bacterium]